MYKELLPYVDKEIQNRFLDVILFSNDIWAKIEFIQNKFYIETICSLIDQFKDNDIVLNKFREPLMLHNFILNTLICPNKILIEALHKFKAMSRNNREYQHYKNHKC